MKGKLILVIGPSGSGKSALLSYLREQMPEVIFPRSCTTRAPRPGEAEGEKYFFVSKEEFERREAAGEFLEWASYGGNYYGVLKGEVLPPLEEGKLVVREVEVQGARQIAAIIPSAVLRMIFIDAGSWETLEQRIRSRAPISDVEILARRKRYEDETAFKPQATRVIENFDGNLEQAKRDFVHTIRELAA
ncbi:MAG TPA: guanylate kinase [Candidatus Paceibacterota bacterium]|nr:guanylate kinase [Candidatus Paceibacterota bacterium]